MIERMYMFRLKLFLPLLPILFLIGCASSKSTVYTGGYDKPVSISQDEVKADLDLLETLESRKRQKLANTPEVKPERTYDLAELIDIAQQRNPATRRAWLQMRQAGRDADVIKSAMLPIIAAAAITGAQHFNNDVTLPFGNTIGVDGTVSGYAGIITANWLLFDFGENSARQDVAYNLVKISRFGFNRVHQQLVFDVAQAFHNHQASLEKQSYAQQATERAAELVFVANRRKEMGIGNTIEVAQAAQLLAQTKLLEQITRGEVNVSRVSLASSLSLPPSTPILLPQFSNSLPALGDRAMETMINDAFSTRPDVLSALAGVRAAQSNIDVVAAAYMPKVMLGANISVGDAGLNLYGVPLNNIGPAQSSGALISVSVPIYDGKLRRTRKRNAKDKLEAARSGVDVVKDVASLEIAIAYEGFRTALAINQAAQELVDAANVTANAAQEAYANGVGTIGEVSLATLGLFAAKETQINSFRAAYLAAATLALALGE
jgi:outer membrane protein